jgi:primosomal protein N'
VNQQSQQQLWLAPREGEASKRWVAGVALPGRSRSPRLFAVPDNLRDQIQIGGSVDVARARGDGTLSGIVVSLSEQPWDQTLLPVVEVDPGLALLDPRLVELGSWIAGHYFSSLHAVLVAMAPVAARQPKPKTQSVLVLADVDLEGQRLTEKQAKLIETLNAGALPKQMPCEQRASPQPWHRVCCVAAFCKPIRESCIRPRRFAQNPQLHSHNRAKTNSL